MSQRQADKSKRVGVSLTAVPTHSSEIEHLVSRFRNTPVPHINGAKTFGDIAAWAPAQFLATYFELSTPILDQAGTPRWGYVIGEVIERNALAHVLYRPRRPTPGVERPWEVAVLHFRRRSERWRYILGRELTTPPMAMFLIQAH